MPGIVAGAALGGAAGGPIGALVGGAGGYLAQKGGLLGGAPSVHDVTPNTINLPGLKVQRNGRAYTVTDTPDVAPLLQQIQSLQSQRADTLRQNADLLGPSYNALTEASLRSLNAERQRTLGNLREQLQRRRVLGSSFAANTIARAGAEYGMKEAQLAAENQLKSIATRTQLLDQASQAELAGVQAQLDRLGFSEQVGAQIIGAMTNSSQAVQNANAQLLAAHQQGMGQVLGTGAGIAAGILLT